MEAIDAARHAYWTEIHHGSGYGDVKPYEAAISAALPHLAKPVDGERLAKAAEDGWNACRRQVYLLSEDYTERTHALKGVDTVEGNFYRGQYDVAKSFAKAFSAFEAKDCDYFKQIDRAALGAGTVEQEPVAWMIKGNGLAVTRDKDVLDRWRLGNPNVDIIPLYAAPPPPAAVQEPVAVKAGDILEQMRPHIATIRNAVRVNNEMGRVMVGQADAAIALGEILDAVLSTSQSDPAPERAGNDMDQSLWRFWNEKARQQVAEIAALRAENERLRQTGTRFLKATDAYVDGESVPEVNLMMEYGDALYAFRAAIAPEQEEAN
jgi:hypothetical protein